MPELPVDRRGLLEILEPSRVSVAGAWASSARKPAGVTASKCPVPQLGNAIGVAIIGVVFYGSLHGRSYIEAFRRGLLFLGGVAASVVVVIQLLQRRLCRVGEGDESTGHPRAAASTPGRGRGRPGTRPDTSA
jgi:hypothetical protein